MMLEELNEKLLDAVRWNEINRVREALALGADINAISGIGDTALILSSWHGNNDITKLLLEYNANVNIKNNDGETALLAACSRSRNHNKGSAVVKILLDAGADPNITDNNKWTPVMYMAAFGHTELIEMFVKAGADIGLKNNKGQTALDILKERHPQKYQKLIEDTVIKARKEQLNTEDSLTRQDVLPDWNI